MSNAIEIRDLDYRAGRSCEIRDLAVNVPAGSMYGFLGPNGAGKTTTIRLLLSLVRPTKGRIAVIGCDVPREAPPHAGSDRVRPGGPHLYPSLSVDERLRYHAAFYPTWDGRWAAELMGAFRLDRHTRFAALSKGPRAQRPLQDIRLAERGLEPLRQVIAWQGHAAHGRRVTSSAAWRPGSSSRPRRPPARR